MMMMPRTLMLLLTASAFQVTDASGQCTDEQHKQSSCVDHAYESAFAINAEACCAKCAAEDDCKQWTHHSALLRCDLTKESDPVKQSVFTLLSTCGRKNAPPSPTPPPVPPAPGMEHTWAVIAAGSAGYMNYRHQADACHAYQIMRKSGIASDHIILMMQDDVANNHENPFRGKLYNKMGSTTDVYEGCNIDYKENVVTKELFMKVLTGDESAGGKVLKSGPDSRVFVNFVDHGGVGIIAFPNGATLHATELSATLKTMQRKRLFSELVFYMEACESGSMFPDLTPDGKIFAVTAANAHESSWGYYCPPNDIANGKHLGSCLGDLFSISWMEDSDLGKLTTETIQEQVARVTKRTNKSHVQTFGDKSLESSTIGIFQLGAKVSASQHPEPINPIGNSVNSRDIHVEYYRMRVLTAKTDAERAQAEKDLEEALADRKADLEVFSQIALKACQGAGLGCDQKLMKDAQSLSAYSCHAQLVQTVHEACPARGPNAPGGWNSYNMQFSQMLANMCQMPKPVAKTTEELSKIVKEECGAASQARGTALVV